MTHVLRLTTFAQPSALLAAQHRGFLEEVGLALEVEQATGSRPQMEGMLAGRWDLAHTNADNVMKFRAFGHGELFIFLVLDRGLGQKLVVSPQVQDWEGLRGRPVGVDAPDSGYAFVLYELLRRHGLQPGDYEVVPLGATAYRLQGLQRGEIQGGLLSHHHEAAALDEGFWILADTRQDFGGQPGVTAATTTSWAQRNPEVLQAYTAALLAASAWARTPENYEDVVRVVAEGRGIDEDRARRVLAIEEAGRTATIGSIEEAEDSLAQTAALRAAYTDSRPTGYFDAEAMRNGLRALRPSTR
jgi:ABC-type nitrate/sulfonate/bicarbonate transport system substrate-binding protein